MSSSGVTLTTKPNVYFEGKTISYSFVDAEGKKKSVGVVLAMTNNFGTQAAEIMECVGGECDYKVKGSEEFSTCKEGETFSIPADSSFDIVVKERFEYLCHYA